MKFGIFSHDSPFSPTEHFIHRASEVTPPVSVARHSLPRYWVLSRALYAIRVIDLKDVPASKRAAALALAQAAWTPYVETAHYVISQLDSAVLCAWDIAAISNAQSRCGIDADSITVIPESALRAAPPPRGAASTMPSNQKIVLRDSLDGVVAVVMTDEQVTAEQWWPTPPSQTVWVNFLRGVGVDRDTHADAPTPLSGTWRNTPIGHAGGSTQSTTSTGETRLVMVAAWILIIPTIWLANEWRQLRSLTNDAQSRLLITERDLNATLGARAQALTGFDRANKLAALVNQPDNLTLFALVNDVIAQTVKAGVLQMTEWELRGKQLKFVMLAPSGGAPSATQLVKAFEKITALSDVEVNTDGARTTISFRISTTTTPPSQSDQKKGPPGTAPTSISGTGK